MGLSSATLIGLLLLPTVPALIVTSGVWIVRPSDRQSIPNALCFVQGKSIPDVVAMSGEAQTRLHVLPSFLPMNHRLQLTRCLCILTYNFCCPSSFFVLLTPQFELPGRRRSAS